MDIKRLVNLTKQYSFFLFGARGTGKSTLIRHTFPAKNSLYIDLLDPTEEDRFAKNPAELIELVNAQPKTTSFIVIDEIQKVPKLLDVVHLLLERPNNQHLFILTGSSAKKLKTTGVNLLAGRAFVYELFPFSYLELKDQFDLNNALRWGMLPKLLQFKQDDERQRFLQAYTQTYLKEEIWAEQLVRNLDPFRRFLEVAAQSNSETLNYSKIGRDVGADDKTVKTYFSLLEDTLLGFMLEPFHHSFRKRLKHSPKFYFFDVGVARALARALTTPPIPSTHYYGKLFEQFIICECFKLARYFQLEYKFSYLLTGANVEIDLVVERPNQPLLFIEIKNTKQATNEHLSTLQSILKDFPNAEAVCLSQDPRIRKLNNITIYPWQQGIKKLFTR